MTFSVLQVKGELQMLPAAAPTRTTLATDALPGGVLELSVLAVDLASTSHVRPSFLENAAGELQAANFSAFQTANGLSPFDELQLLQEGRMFAGQFDPPRFRAMT